MFSINNRIIKSISFSNLLKHNIEIPNEQRIVDIIKVNEIVSYQLNHIKKHKITNFLGVINIHKFINNYYLVDGHHRYQACKKLFNEYSHDVCLAVEFVNVDSKEELKNNYALINKNTTLPEFPDNIDKNIPEITAKYFMNKYPQIWSKSAKCKRPHIFFNHFQESLGYLTEHLPNITLSDELIQIVEDYNIVLSEWNLDAFPSGANEAMYKKCKEWKCYLGLFNHISTQEYGYEWTRKLIEHRTGEKIKLIKSSKKRKGIPKKVKNDSWDKFVGSEYGSTYCLVCVSTVINSKNFEAGHIISDKNSGKSIVDNILPICGQCNKCISSKNMDEYVKEFHPENYENYKNKIYKPVILVENKQNKKGFFANIF
jgi:hypothetical protein